MEDTKKYFKLTRTIIGPILLPFALGIIVLVFLDNKNPIIGGGLLAMFFFVPSLILFLWDLAIIIHLYRKQNEEGKKNFRNQVKKYFAEQWDVYLIFAALFTIAYLFIFLLHIIFPTK